VMVRIKTESRESRWAREGKGKTPPAKVVAVVEIDDPATEPLPGDPGFKVEPQPILEPIIQEPGAPHGETPSDPEKAVKKKKKTWRKKKS